MGGRVETNDMTCPTLSVLDPSPIFKGRTASDALNETRALAQAVDAMAYRSYWVQEHHNAASFAGTTPEVLMADLAARTSRITFGSSAVPRFVRSTLVNSVSLMLY